VLLFGAWLVAAHEDLSSANLDRGAGAGAAHHETALLDLQAARQHLEPCAGGRGQRHFLTGGADTQRQLALTRDDEAAGPGGLELEAGAGALSPERQSSQPERALAARSLQLAAGPRQVVFGAARRPASTIEAGIRARTAPISTRARSAPPASPSIARSSLTPTSISRGSSLLARIRSGSRSAQGRDAPGLSLKRSARHR
jgi:hypothetical protein